MYGAVIDHIHYRNPEIAADSEGNAEAQAAHDSDDVAARQPEARAVNQRSFPLSQLFGAAIFRQLDHFACFLLLLNNSGNETLRNFRIALPQNLTGTGVYIGNISININLAYLFYIMPISVSWLYHLIK